MIDNMIRCRVIAKKLLKRFAISHLHTFILCMCENFGRFSGNIGKENIRDARKAFLIFQFYFRSFFNVAPDSFFVFFF